MEKEIEMEREAVVIGAGGAVNSVNGQTGDVVLTTSDLENTSDYQTGTEVESAISTAIAGIDIPTKTSDLTNDGATGTSTYVEATALAAETTARENADNGLQGQIDALSAASDVADIVGTKAELNAYDTSQLKDNDIIKVLQDESENDETTYYRWSTTTQSFTLIGEEGPYYTKAATDALLQGKQDTLTAGTNITIDSSNVISAADTTYTHFTGATASTDGVQGLVPGPLAGDEDKYLKGDGTWGAVQAGPTVVQTTGTSTTDVMSQNATTSMVFADPATQQKVKIGTGTGASQGNYSVEIGDSATAGGASSVALGRNAVVVASNNGGTALGSGAQASGAGGIAIAGGWNGASAAAAGAIRIGGGNNAVTGQGAMSIGYFTPANDTQGKVEIGTTETNYGYNSSNYRLLSGLYDPQSAHDAATKGYVDTAVAGAGAATINSTDWSALWQ